MRILLRNKNAFDDLAKQSFDLQSDGNYEEVMLNLDAATYKLDNGKVVATKLVKSEIFKEKVKNQTTVKFTFPAVEEGCIIEYDYTQEDPNNLYIPGHYFQSSYPKLLTQYTVEIPNYYDYVVLKKGYLRPFLDSVNAQTKTYMIRFSNGAGSSTTDAYTTSAIWHIWGYKNVPALKDEDYISSYDDYRESIRFQLSMIKYPQQSPKFFRKSWDELVKELREDEEFGTDLNKANNWLDELIIASGANAGADIEKTKKIYTYIRDHYECINDEAIYMSQAPQKTMKSLKGNVADINLLLTLSLRHIGLNANPVLVSTRDNGKPNVIFPWLGDFNYVISNVQHADGSFCLDASQPLGFGQISNECYGGGARLIADAPVIVPLYTDSIHENSISSLFMNNDENGNLIGHYTSKNGMVKSQNYRGSFARSGSENYLTQVKQSFSEGITVSEIGFDSLKNLDEPLQLHLDLNIQFKADVEYFNPMLLDAIETNPFEADERLYPVEMDYCKDDTYILNMEIPAGYKVDEMPKSARVTFNDNEGFYEYLIQTDGQRLMLRSRLKLNRATFQPDDYASLREFYAFVVQKMSEQIVFKKQ